MCHSDLGTACMPVMQQLGANGISDSIVCVHVVLGSFMLTRF